MNGDGCHLSDLDSGALFSIGPVGRRYLVSWTLPETDDAWLALDRDGNGMIDIGQERSGYSAHPQGSRGRCRLEGLGLAEVRQRGSHKQFRLAHGRGATVPFHAGRDISPTLLRRIAKDIG